MTEAAAVEQIFDALVRERGLDRLTIVQKALCRKAAQALVDDDSHDAAELMKLLPEPTMQPLDLSRLSDRQLEGLKRLVALATPGEIPPPKARREKREQTRQQIEALHLAAVLDRIIAAKRKPTEPERLDLVASIDTLLHAVGLRQVDCWPAYLVHPGAGDLPLSGGDETVARVGNRTDGHATVTAGPSMAPPAADNVITLPLDRWQP